MNPHIIGFMIIVLRNFIAHIIAFLALIHSCTAVVLDWNQTDWSAGSTSQIITNVGGSGYNVQITLSISSGNWVTLDDTARYDGNDGLYNGDESLQLTVDFLNNIYTNSYVMVEMRFLNEYNSITPVNNLSFDIFDIDRGADVKYKGNSYYTYEDVIWGFTSYDENWNSSTQNHTVTTGSNVYTDANASSNNGPLYRGTLADGSYDDQNASAHDSSSSTMNVSWNDSVNYVKFYYSTGSNALWDQDKQHKISPSLQSIGIGNLSFGDQLQPVPEASTVISASLLGLAALFLSLRKRFHKKASLQAR